MHRWVLTATLTFLVGLATATLGPATVDAKKPPKPASVQSIQSSAAIASANIALGVLTSASAPIGIDFHEPTGKLIISVNYDKGLPHNLELVNTDGVTKTQFTGLAGLTEELKIATVRTSPGCQQFPVGTVFTGNGVAGQIVRINPGDPPTVQNPWTTLPLIDASDLIRGSLYVDRGCAFGGDLIVATSDEETGGGKIYRVNAAGVGTLIVDLEVALGAPIVHLEGLITLPNLPSDVVRYGPWAGKILVGAELYSQGTPGCPSGGPENLACPGSLFAIAADGSFQRYELEDEFGNFVKPEDLDLIETSESFFGANFGTQTILTAPGSAFAGMDGDLLITQEYRPGSNPSNHTGLYHVKWNGATFVVTALLNTSDVQIGQWEHVTFAPTPDLKIEKAAVDATITAGENADFLITLTAGAAAVGGIDLADQLPNGTLQWSLVSVNPPAQDPDECSVTNNLLECDFEELGPNEAVTITVRAATSLDMCQGLASFEITNPLATATADGGLTRTAGPVTITVECPLPLGGAALCAETVNPAGRNIPPAGSTQHPNQNQQNPDGFYRISSATGANVFVVDLETGVVFGPFPSGTNIKYTEANGATPSQKAMGGPNSAVDWHIKGQGDMGVTTDPTGQTGLTICRVPPPPF